MQKHLYLSHVTNLDQIFTGFEYAEKGGPGWFFISSPLSQHLGTHSYDAKRDVATIHKAKFCSLYATGLKPGVREAVEPHMIGAIGSFEICKREDGYLIIARCETVGERWLCLLPADYDLKQHLPETARAQIDASNASFNEAIKDAPETSYYKKR